MLSHMLAAAALAATPAQDPSAGLSQRELVIQFGVSCNSVHSAECSAARSRWAEMMASATACHGQLPLDVRANSRCDIALGRAAAAAENRAARSDNVSLVALTETHRAAPDITKQGRGNSALDTFFQGAIAAFVVIVGGTLWLHLSNARRAAAQTPAQPAAPQQKTATTTPAKKRRRPATRKTMPKGRVEAYIRAAEAQAAQTAARTGDAPTDHSALQREQARRAEYLRREMTRPHTAAHAQRDTCGSDMDRLDNCYRDNLYNPDARFVSSLRGANAAIEHLVDEIIEHNLTRHDLISGVVVPRHVCALLDKANDDMYVFFAIPAGWANEIGGARKAPHLFYARLKGAEVRQRSPQFGNKYVGDTTDLPALMPADPDTLPKLSGNLRGLPVQNIPQALRGQMIQALRIAAAREDDDCSRASFATTANAMATKPVRRAVKTLAAIIKPLHRTLRGYWEPDAWRQHRFNSAPVRPRKAVTAKQAQTTAPALTLDAIAA